MASVCATTPTIVYSGDWDSGECSMCGAEITKESRRANIFSNYVKRGNRYTCIEPICAHCLHMVSAEKEAEIEQVRFTRVSVGFDGTRLSDYYGSRCLCGAASLRIKGLCVQCWRAQRMLGKAQSEIRAIKKMTEQINKHIKELKNGTQ